MKRSEVKVMSNSLRPHVLHNTIYGILQARMLELVVIPFSRRSSQPRDRTQVSRTAGKSLPGEPHEQKSLPVVHGAAKSWARLSDYLFHICFHIKHKWWRVATVSEGSNKATYFA